MAYVGDTRSRKLLARCRAEGIGQLMVRGRAIRDGKPLARLRPWVYDNGAFSDWKAGRAFDWPAFWLDVAAIRKLAPEDRPRWLVAPDIVGGGCESLARSVEVIAEHKDLPWMLAVQDGMTSGDVLPHLAGAVGIFVGGTLEWKLATGARWVQLARGAGVECHIGRVGSGVRVAWAQWTGCDSIDSCLPLFSTKNANIFFRALRQPPLFRAGDVRRVRGDE